MISGMLCMISFVPPSKSEFECTKQTIMVLFEKNLEDLINEKADRFGLNQHEAQIEEIFQKRHSKGHWSFIGEFIMNLIISKRGSFHDF